MILDILRDAESRMKGAIQALETDLSQIRTGRASPALVENLKIDYYGTPTPLYQLATITVPEAQLIVIRPFDPSSINTIEKAIQTSDLNLPPNNDGQVIRLAIPPLTEERRRDLTKVVHKRLEQSRVAIRNVRRDAQDDMREVEKEKLCSEDEFRKGQDDLQKLTDTYNEKVEEVGERKEAEIMEV